MHHGLENYLYSSQLLACDITVSPTFPLSLITSLCSYIHIIRVRPLLPILPLCSLPLFGCRMERVVSIISKDNVITIALCLFPCHTPFSLTAVPSLPSIQTTYSYKYYSVSLLVYPLQFYACPLSVLVLLA